MTSIRIHAAVLACLITSACIHNPNRGQTALQKTIVANATVAKTNAAVEKAVEDAVAGAVLTPAKAKPVIVGCLKVAQASEAIRAITSKGTEASWSVDGPKIRALLAATPLKISPGITASIDLLITSLNSTIDLLTSGVK